VNWVEPLKEEGIMGNISVDIVDAFADRPFTGNPAAILPEAEGLSDEEMQLISNELQMEAGFVLPPTKPEADVRLRFFTPRREATLSGHVIVAAFVSLAERGRYNPSGEGIELRQETAAGVWPVLLARRADGRIQVTFDLPPPRFGEPVPASEVAAALHVPSEIVKFQDHSPQRVSCGFDLLVVPITDRNVARGAFEDIASIRRLADQRGVGGVVCFCPETSSPEVDLFCRFFYPSIGTNEDVVSGTSLGAIAAYCLDKEVLPRADRVRIVTEQGHMLGRPNRAEMDVHLEGRQVTRVRLTGTGAVVLRGEFQLMPKAAATSS
jgi:trans-2,3-dihydro-3-hydroxyanthranilate isomerase